MICSNLFSFIIRANYSCSFEVIFKPLNSTLLKRLNNAVLKFFEHLLASLKFKNATGQRTFYYRSVSLLERTASSNIKWSLSVNFFNINYKDLLENQT
jgi:hypothetical protein